MKSLILLFIIAVSFVAEARKNPEGGYVGDGGFAIECHASPQNFLNGTYALDYVLTSPSAQKPDDLVEVKSWEASAERLQKLFQDKIPSLLPYFKEFRSSVFNTQDLSKTKIWEAAPFGLTDLDDQRITALIPENCRVGEKLMAIPAVIRQSPEFSGTKHAVVYKYVPSVVEALNQQDPLQLSFLMVHEWLWDLSPNVDRNRRVNRFLHSKKIESMTAAEIETALKTLGLSLPGIQPDVFDPQSCQGRLITEAEFLQRYPGDHGTRNLGAISFDSRVRTIRCQDTDPTCNQQWMKNTNADYFFSKYKFFGVFSWESQTKQTPVGITSLDLIQSDGGFWRDGRMQIACGFQEGPTNLHCTFEDHRLYTPLTSAIAPESQEKWPEIQAVLTDECLRLSVRSYKMVDVLTDGTTARSLDEFESVIFVRYKWR